MFEFIFILVILFICAVIIIPSRQYENFEQVKIRFKENPLNLNLNCQGNSCPPCNNNPDVIVPVYAPWKTYWPAELVYPYYPFYPYYYNNYYWPY